MEYIFSSVFGQVFVRHGAGVAMVILVLFVVVVLVAYYIKGQIDSARIRDTNAAAVEAARDAERRQEREKHEAFLQSLVAQSQANTEKFIVGLNAIEKSCQSHCQTMMGLKATLERHQEDSAKGRGAIHTRLNAIQMQIAGVKSLPVEGTQE